MRILFGPSLAPLRYSEESLYIYTHEVDEFLENLEAVKVSLERFKSDNSKPTPKARKAQKAAAK